MISIGKGVISGLIASALVAGGLHLAAASGLVGPVDPVWLASGVMLFPTALGWIAFAALGALVWGPSFALLGPVLPDPMWFKGLVFGAGAWLLTILAAWAAEPTAGLQTGAASVVLHLALGLLLGATYGVLLDEHERGTSRPSARRARYRPT